MLLPEDCSFELKMLHQICTADTRSRILQHRRDNLKTSAEAFRDMRLEMARQTIMSLFADKADGQTVEELRVSYKNKEERLVVDSEGWIDESEFMDAWNKKWIVKQEQTLNSFLDSVKQQNRPIMKALVKSAEAVNKQQLAVVWLTSLPLGLRRQRVIELLQQCSLETMKKLRDADMSHLMKAGCTDEEAQVIAAPAAAAIALAAAATALAATAAALA